MEMELTVLERMMLLYVLTGVQGNIFTVKTLHNVRMQVALTDKEQEFLEVRVNDDGNAQWSDEKDKELGTKAFEWSSAANKMIKAELQRQSEEGKLSAQHIQLYEKFHGEIEIE